MDTRTSVNPDQCFFQSSNDAAMATSGTPLDQLRREIDAIDDALHDLIMRRAEVVRRVAGAKESAGGRAVLRPGREARILRRLVARHEGAFPMAALIRIWRELISASVAMQAPFPVAVFLPEPDPGYWDLAREQFGNYAPMIPMATPEATIAEVAEGRATVAVLPMPSEPMPSEEEDEDAAWWTAPAFRRDKDAGTTPHVIWHLPFTGTSSGPRAGLQAVVLSLAPPEDSGEDHSLFLFETAAAGALANLMAALAAHGLTPIRFVAREDGAKGLVLVVLEGYIEAHDPRLLAVADEIGRVYGLGGYPVPFDVPDPGAAKRDEK